MGLDQISHIAHNVPVTKAKQAENILKVQAHMRQVLKMPNNIFSANATEKGLNMPNYDVNAFSHAKPTTFSHAKPFTKAIWH